MSYRYMRVMVLFDLPVETVEQRRAYRKFRKGLIRHGFLMFQESVYIKLALNPTAQKTIINNIRKICPKEGLVNMLCLTEKQFQRIECVVGKNRSDLISSTERLVIL